MHRILSSIYKIQILFFLNKIGINGKEQFQPNYFTLEFLSLISDIFGRRITYRFIKCIYLNNLVVKWINRDVFSYALWEYDISAARK